jgi:hypothetical protein
MNPKKRVRRNMSKKMIFISITLIGLFFLSAFSVYASPVHPGQDTKPSQDKTPGAQATANAILHASQGKGQGGKKANFKGVIVSASATDLTITLADGTSASFALTPDTRISVPTLGKSATFAELLPGLQVHVRAQKDDGGLYTALSVSVTPGKPIKVHRVGIVNDYQPGVSITIQAKDGNLYTFTLTPDTKILPADRTDQLIVGARVTIISPRDVATGQSVAAGIVVHPTTGTAEEPETVESPEPEESPAP